jgi:hypothetical protein
LLLLQSRIAIGEAGIATYPAQALLRLAETPMPHVRGLPLKMYLRYIFIRVDRNRKPQQCGDNFL